MKHPFINFLLVALIIVAGISCNGQTEKTNNSTKQNESVSADTIHVYYFHSNIRCKTCVAVDEHTHQLLKDLFPEQMKNGIIVFKSINVDEKGNEALIEKYKIWGQTMLFIKGDTVVDRTNDAFMNVLEEPDKWEGMVEEQVIRLLKM